MMNIEQEITNYFNENYKRSIPAIIDILCVFLGEKHRELITDKVNTFEIIYFVNRRNLRNCLRNSQIDDGEKELIEYFLNKMDNSANLDFGKMGLKELVAFLETQNLELIPKGNDVLKISKTILELSEKDKSFVEGSDSDSIENDLRKYCEKLQLTTPNYHIIGNYGQPQLGINTGNLNLKIGENSDEKYDMVILPIYDEIFSPDISLFNGILRCIVKDYKSFENELAKKAYAKARFYFGIMLAEELHKKDIFIFDNKYLTQSEKLCNKIQESKVFKKIKEYFGSLFSEFIFNPNKVIELIGADNFRKFALWFIYLAPRLLDDEYEIDEEELEELASLPTEIPYEELDIDINEVLDDMYVEYLKHQEVSLVAIDIPKIVEAKKSLIAKEEKERQDEEEDSKYFTITRVFKYLEKYGNCQIRFISSNKTCDMLDFKINEDGKLVITKNIEIYDRCPFTYDGDIDASAKLKYIKKVATYDKEDDDLVMSSILCYSLYNMSKISTNRALKPVSIESVSEIYDVVYPMYDLDLNDLIEWVKSEPSGQMNILLSQNKDCKGNHNFQIIEYKTKKLSEKIKSVLSYWKKMQNAHNEEEYKKAASEWDNLEKGILKL